MKKLQTVSESISIKEEVGADISIISFIGEDEEGSEKGIKFAVKKPFTEALFKTIHGALSDDFENVFPDEFSDMEEESWESNEGSLEKDLETVQAELEEAPYYVQVLEDYV